MSLTPFVVLTLVVVHQAFGQSCTWTWIEPPGGTSITRSIGAPVTVTASVNDVLSNSDFLTWKIDTTDLIIQEYVSASSTFNDVVNARSFTASRTSRSDGGVGNEYTLTFPTGGVGTGDSGSITVTSQGCTTGGTSPGVSLIARYCDTSNYFSIAIAADPSNCGYNCERQFVCVNGAASFVTTCQLDATWEDIRTQLGEYIAAVGLMATSIVLFVGQCGYVWYLRSQKYHSDKDHEGEALNVLISIVTKPQEEVLVLIAGIVVTELAFLIVVISLVAVNGGCFSTSPCCLGSQPELCYANGCYIGQVIAACTMAAVLVVLLVCLLAATIYCHTTILKGRKMENKVSAPDTE